MPSPDADAPPTGLLPGRKLGQYAIAEKIGEGGMGLVYKAVDTALDRTVALKVMFCAAHEDSRQAQRFIREARAMARLSHPNLLHVYSVGSEKDCHYFAMELLRGETLLSAIRRLNRIPAPDLMFYAVQIVSALYYVHKRGITHRDIKSGNIMLCGRRAVLMDFGLAKDETDSGLTSVGAIMGTPDYMPPEAAEGRTDGPPTDIYSLGVVLYEALSGRLPFLGKSAISIIRQHIDTPPPPLQSLVPEIKPELAAIVHKCLEKNPENRFADCPALARALWDIVPEQSLLDVAEGRVPGADAMPLEQMYFGAVTGGNPAVPSRTQSGGVPTLAELSTQPTIAMPVTQPVSPPKPRPRQPVKNAAKATTRRPRMSAGLAETEPVLAARAPKTASAGFRNGFGAWRDFSGVFVLVALLFRAQKNGPEQPKPPAFSGQPVVRKGAAGNEKEVLIEFKGGDADPQNWYFLVRRQQPDGSWKELKIPYRDYVSSKSDTEIIFTSDEAQKKP